MAKKVKKIETMVAIARRSGKTTVHQLVKDIKDASQAYYLGESVLSDKEFDAKVNKLRKLAPKSRILTLVGWGVKVHGTKVKLPATIRKSLDKYHDVPSLRKALRNPKRAVIGPKLDGLSALLKFDVNGKLKLACTRGDGVMGVDITIKMPFLHEGMALLRGPGGKVIRGELVVPIPVYNAYLKDRYKNPRDAASGIINGKSFENLDKVFFVAHDPVLGFDGEFAEYMVGPVNEEVLGEFYKKIVDAGYYGIDGLVIHTKTDLQNKVAFKFPTEALEGTVKEVHWGLSDTMQLNPTVELEERFQLYGKEIGGSITAHNAEYIVSQKIGPGAKVLVSRANEIIPEIVEVVKPGRHNFEWVDETKTPLPPLTYSYIPRNWDGHPIFWDGPRLFVKNDKWEKEFRVNRFLKHYFMPEGIQDSENLRQALKINNIQDIRDLIGRRILVEKRLRRAKLGYGTKKIAAILPMFSKKRKLNPSVFFKAMGIRYLGDTVSEIAAPHLILFKDRHPHTWRSMCDRVSAAKHVAAAIKDNWEYMKNVYLLFADMMDSPQVVKEATKGSIVMTGKGWLPREDLRAACVDFGFDVQDSVSKDTSMLVQEDPSSQSGKSKKARLLGIKIVDYAALKRILTAGGT